MDIVVSGLNVIVHPSLDGMNYGNCQLTIDGHPFPQEWGVDEWDRVRMNSIIHFVGEFEITGKVVDFYFKEEPYIVLDACFKGKEKHLVTPEHLECFGYYFINERSFKQAKVKPLWLFPSDFTITWKAYKTIKDVLGNWHPFRPLSLAEIRKCVWIAYPDTVSWDKNKWVELIEQGYFALSIEVKRIHNALKLADKVYSNGWPISWEFLALWFNLDQTQWIWALPGSIIMDKTGIYGIYISKNEFEPKTLLRKLLFPNIDIYYKAESTYGPNSPA